MLDKIGIADRELPNGIPQVEKNKNTFGKIKNIGAIKIK